MGFSLSELERNRLIEEGFSPDMISTGDKPFKFLGCQIKPSFLRDGAVCRLSELCDDMQEIANAFNDEKTTLKGRRLVCQTILLSRLQSAIITAFKLKESDMKRIKKNHRFLCPQEKVSAGKRKYLSFSATKIFWEISGCKNKPAQGHFYQNLKPADYSSIPSWAHIMIEGLRFIGYNSPILLFRSFGQSVYCKKVYRPWPSCHLAGLFRRYHKRHLWKAQMRTKA